MKPLPSHTAPDFAKAELIAINVQCDFLDGWSATIAGKRDGAARTCQGGGHNDARVRSIRLLAATVSPERQLQRSPNPEQPGECRSGVDRVRPHG